VDLSFLSACHFLVAVKLSTVKTSPQIEEENRGCNASVGEGGLYLPMNMQGFVKQQPVPHAPPYGPHPGLGSGLSGGLSGMPMPALGFTLGSHLESVPFPQGKFMQLTGAAI
jgi:hypothetical protein